MPKLPQNFVKPPVFDNPIRATSGEKLAVPAKGRRLVLELTDAQLAALRAAAENERLSVEAKVARILDEWIDRTSAPSRPTAEPIREEPRREPAGLVAVVLRAAAVQLAKLQERSGAFRRLSAFVAAHA